MKLTAPKFDEEEILMLRECLDSHWVTQGPLTARFQDSFARRQDVQYALATTSCTAALHLGTLALGLGPGDEVLVPAFTWVTSAHCVEYVGARVRFVDVEPTTYNLNAEALESAVTSSTVAVVAVHLFGFAAPMDEIMSLARRKGLKVIEDAACAVGTTYKGKPVGGIGDIGCFSFHPRKIITTGEGGMVTTDDEAIAERVQSLRNHGATGLPPPDDEERGPWTMATFDQLGYNLRLSDIQAAVGIAQLDKLDALLAERRLLAARYSELLAGEQDIQIPTSDAGAGHTFQSYVIRVNEGGRPRRNRVMATFAKDGIETRPGTHAVHQLGYYRQKYGLRPEDFPVAVRCQDTTITLPLFPGMTESAQDTVIASLKNALRQSG